MRTVRRLRLRFLSSSARFPQPYGFHIAERHYLYSWPNRSCVRPIIKYTSQYIDGPYIFTIPFFGWSKGSLPRLSILSNTSQEMYSIKHTRTTIAPKKTWKSKCYANVFYGGPGRHCPAVLNPFLSNSLRCSLYCIFIFDCCQPLVLGLHLTTIFLFWDRNSCCFWDLACSHSAWVLYLACSPDSGTGPNTLQLNTQIKVWLTADS